MITETDALCADISTTTAALMYLRTELAAIGDCEKLSGGLRDAVCAMIDRNDELVERLVVFVEDAERAKRELPPQG